MQWPARSLTFVFIATSLALVTACGIAGAQRTVSAATSTATPTAQPTPSTSPSITPTGFVPSPPQAAITTFPILASDSGDTVIQVRLGPDGAMWFTTGGIGPGALGTITTAGVFTTWPLPWPGGSVSDFTFGDGFLWSIENHGVNDAFIGKWTLTGTLVQEFPIPGTDYAIVWGPDGALWFSGATLSGMDFSSAFIGRMTVQGVVTQYAMPDGDDIAGGLTTGPDGAIWFSEVAGIGVGRVTTSGVITEYTVPGGGDFAPTVETHTIVAGPDGALWSISKGELTRVTSDGAVTVFPASEPSSISTNPDGDMWFLGNDPGTHDPAVLRMTTDGATTADYPLDGTPGITLGDPAGITTGADGMLWFGDGNAIARLDPSIPPTT
jgi:streptogramin lyase